MVKAVLSFILFACVCFSSLYAQGPKVDAPRVTLGVPRSLDTAHVTCEALLANTRLIAVDQRWRVTRFSISFTLPDGKTYGPFQTEGCDLTDQQKKLIKRLKGKNAEINITQINVLFNGMEKFTYPIRLRYNQ
jgi:hypothetical protein